MTDPKSNSSSSPASPNHPIEGKTTKQLIIENVISLSLALIIVFTIRSSVVEPFKIPSGSMIPTLMIGDHILVNKFAYGFKVPFSDLFTDSPIYMVQKAPPKRGDIIVFKYPKNESIYYIKRVVGVAGDRIEIKNKLVYINNKGMSRKQVDESRSDAIFKSIDDDKYTTDMIDIYEEHLDQVNHELMLDKTNFMMEDYGPIIVPANSLFVMGDNRDFSNDSRFWGFVPLRNVKGRAMFVWMSLWIHWPGSGEAGIEFRPDRIGTVLH